MDETNYSQLWFDMKRWPGFFACRPSQLCDIWIIILFSNRTLRLKFLPGQLLCIGVCFGSAPQPAVIFGTVAELNLSALMKQNGSVKTV